MEKPADPQNPQKGIISRAHLPETFRGLYRYQGDCRQFNNSRSGVRKIVPPYQGVGCCSRFLSWTEVVTNRDRQIRKGEVNNHLFRFDKSYFGVAKSY